ncbi:hypothetical protein Hanom_Chr16g01444591 [Helianthus anomalus]
MDGAKLSATIAMLKIKLQMAKEAADPSFDRSEWDLEAWAKRLVELGDEYEPEDAAAGGSGKGGEEKVDVTPRKCKSFILNIMLVNK